MAFTSSSTEPGAVPEPVPLLRIFAWKVILGFNGVIRPAAAASRWSSRFNQPLAIAYCLGLPVWSVQAALSAGGDIGRSNGSALVAPSALPGIATTLSLARAVGGIADLDPRHDRQFHRHAIRQGRQCAAGLALSCVMIAAILAVCWRLTASTGVGYRAVEALRKRCRCSPSSIWRLCRAQRQRLLLPVKEFHPGVPKPDGERVAAGRAAFPSSARSWGARGALPPTLRRSIALVRRGGHSLCGDRRLVAGAACAGSALPASPI